MHTSYSVFLADYKWEVTLFNLPISKWRHRNLKQENNRTNQMITSQIFVPSLIFATCSQKQTMPIFPEKNLVAHKHIRIFRAQLEPEPWFEPNRTKNLKIFQALNWAWAWIHLFQSEFEPQNFNLDRMINSNWSNNRLPSEMYRQLKQMNIKIHKTNSKILHHPPQSRIGTSIFLQQVLQTTTKNLHRTCII